MKFICVLLALASTPYAVAANPGKPVKNSPNPATAKARRALQQRGAQWIRAIAERDVATLDDLLAGEVTVVDVSGKVHGKEHELKLRGMFVPHLAFNNTMENVRVYGDAGIVTGLYTVRVQPPQGRVYWMPSRYSCFWAKRAGKWQIVALQFTRIIEE